MEVTVDTARGLEVRTRVVTQTLTRPFTTITAVVTLGDGPTTTATTTTSSPLSSGTIIPAAPSGSLTPEQLGALLGSVFGLLFVALLVCCSIVVNRRRQQAAYYYEDSISESEVAQYETFGSTAAWNLYRGRASYTTVPPPVRFPPTPRHTTYSQTRATQIGGVRRYP